MLLLTPSHHPLLTLFIFLPPALSHSFILSLDGANGVQASGFGTRLTTRGQIHQYTGIITDQEIKSGTVGPCGRIFGGDDFPPFVIDPKFELSRAESSGIPTVHKDGSIVMGIFVHNPDGSGPFKCDYSSDGSLHNFEPMKINTQIEGIDGVNPAAQNFVYPLTAAFFPNATCTGGKSRDTCIVRCRNQLGFGSCAALKLGEAAQRPEPQSKVIGPARANSTLQASHKETSKPTNKTDTTSSDSSPAPPNVVIVPNGTTAKTDSHSDDRTGSKRTSQLTNGPDPRAFEIYNSNPQSPPPTPPLNLTGDPHPINGVSSLPPPHDPNYNPLTADLPPSRPTGVERRSLRPPTFKKRQFLHKRPRRTYHP